MRTRNSMPTYFYTHPAYRKLSSDARSLLLYLNTNTYTNLLGCYYLPLHIIKEELQWDNEKALNMLAELMVQELATYDAQQEWVWVSHFLLWNPLHNECHGKGLAKCFRLVPSQVSFYQDLVHYLEQTQIHLTPDFVDELSALQDKPPHSSKHKQAQMLKLLKKAFEHASALCL